MPAELVQPRSNDGLNWLNYFYWLPAWFDSEKDSNKTPAFCWVSQYLIFYNLEFSAAHHWAEKTSFHVRVARTNISHFFHVFPPGSDAECLNFSAPDLWWRHWLWRLAECVLLSGLMGVVMFCPVSVLDNHGKQPSNLAIRVYIWVIYGRWSKYLLVVLISWSRSVRFLQL